MNRLKGLFDKVKLVLSPRDLEMAGFELVEEEVGKLDGDIARAIKSGSGRLRLGVPSRDRLSIFDWPGPSFGIPSLDRGGDKFQLETVVELSTRQVKCVRLESILGGVLWVRSDRSGLQRALDWALPGFGPKVESDMRSLDIVCVRMSNPKTGERLEPGKLKRKAGSAGESTWVGTWSNKLDLE